MRPGSILRVQSLGPIIAATSQPSGVVVDFGGFDGTVSSISGQDGARLLVVLDVDRNAVHDAQSKGVQGVVGSALTAPIKSGSVDTVLCLDVIEHVEDDLRLLKEISRVLRPGGTVVLSTTCHDFNLPLVTREWLNRRWGHVRNGYTDSDLQGLLDICQLKVVRKGRYFTFLSRLLYTLFFIFRLPPVPLAARLLAFEAISRLETRFPWGGLEHWMVAQRAPIPAKDSRGPHRSLVIEDKAEGMMEP